MPTPKEELLAGAGCDKTRLALVEEISKLGTINEDDELFRLCKILLIHHTLVESLPDALSKSASQAEESSRRIETLLEQVGNMTAESIVKEIKTRNLGDIEKSIQTIDKSGVKVAQAGAGLKKTFDQLNQMAYEARQLQLKEYELTEKIRWGAIWGWGVGVFALGAVAGAVFTRLLAG